MALLQNLTGSSSSGGGSGIDRVNYDFTDVDGSTGITITHNLGYMPAVVVTGTLASSGTPDYASFAEAQHLSVNQFKVEWLGGLASGRISY